VPGDVKVWRSRAGRSESRTWHRSWVRAPARDGVACQLPDGVQTAAGEVVERVQGAIPERCALDVSRRWDGSPGTWAGRPGRQQHAQVDPGHPRRRACRGPVSAGSHVDGTAGGWFNSRTRFPSRALVRTKPGAESSWSGCRTSRDLRRRRRAGVPRGDRLAMIDRAARPWSAVLKAWRHRPVDLITPGRRSRWRYPRVPPLPHGRDHACLRSENIHVMHSSGRIRSPSMGTTRWMTWNVPSRPCSMRFRPGAELTTKVQRHKEEGGGRVVATDGA